MPADPILTSNPLDPESWRITKDILGHVRRGLAACTNPEGEEPDDHKAVRLVEAECERARAAEDLLRARGDLWKARSDEFEASVASLKESLAYENEKVRSLSASVEEMRTEASEWHDLYDAESDRREAAERAAAAAVLREREECARFARLAAMSPEEQALCDELRIPFSSARTMFEAGRNAAERAIRARSK